MKIHIPTPLRAYTDKQESVEVTGATVAAGLQGLVETYPALRHHLFTPEGKLRSFVNVYLRDEDVRYLPEKEETAVTDADEMTIIPSIAGGSRASIPELLRESVRLSEAVPNPAEDMEHAHMLLAQMTPDELLQATFALEEIVEESPRFAEKMGAMIAESEKGPWIPMSQVLAEAGFPEEASSGRVEPPKHGQAA